MAGNSDRNRGGRQGMAADGPGIVVAAAEPSFKRGGNARSRRSDRRADPRVAPVRLRIVARRPGRADDLVQDALERALSHWNLRRNEGNLRGWLYTILYNRFLSDQHRVRRRGPHDPLSQETELPGIDGGQHSALEHRDVLRALAALPEEQRAVLLLVGVEDLSYQEAARVLGVPIGTVMSRLSRGRERLRAYYLWRARRK